ncbi:MAG: hypothetical protein EU532_04520 [Promethearchaeota archaeon]|nr:MAG: hypothetical protein EU532_04520 [Candidatus Lokiarchaeota archaeon]
MEKFLYEGALEKLEMILEERVKRFRAFANKMEKSIKLYKSIMGDKAKEELIKQKSELFESRERIENGFYECQSYTGEEKKRNDFIKNIDLIIKKIGIDYIKVIKNLDEYSVSVGNEWLLSIIVKIRNTILSYLPSFI